MSPPDAARLQALFAAAVELPAGLREELLARECAQNPELLAKLRGLLKADAKVLGTTVRPLARGLCDLLTPATPEPSLRGTRVGPYELHEELGRGGMGTVYRAERVDGHVEQKVAIKFVRRELLDAHTLKRFQLERQLMATLDHPHIARLLDASELADGTPYFVMEYVDGVAITDYCERENLDVRERVVLLRKVCSAVAEAHRELIVHRDLKPANILIGAGGTPKLLDFGIAKPLSASVGRPAGEATGTAQRYFSPQYAAPEQLRGAPVGIACDVYALGLLSYELLANTRPFDFAQLSAGQIERLILDTPPPAPSVALSRHATNGFGVRPRQLQGDLDGIVLRCLRKAPHERYASVEQLEADLGHYLDGRPVQARGGHGWYRAQKFVRRNKFAVAASALMIVSLLTGVVAFAAQARIARQRAAELEQVSRFQAEMLGQVDPTQAGRLLSDDLKAKFERALIKAGVPEPERIARIEVFGREWRQVNVADAARDLIDRTVLKPAADAIDKQFADQPLVDASLRQVLANRYRDMGLYEAALALQERALSTRRRLLASEHADTIASIRDMGALLLRQGKLREAEPYLRDALDKRRRVLGGENPATMESIDQLGVVLLRLGKLSEAEPYLREALEKRRRVLGEEHPDTLESISNIGTLLYDRGKLREAEPYARETLDKRRRVLGDDHPDTMTAIGNMGALLQLQGKSSEAERYDREALERRRRVLGEEHPDTLSSISTLGYLLHVQGRLSEAEAYMRAGLEARRRVLGDEHPATLRSINALGSLHVAQGKYAEAVALLTPAETTIRKTFTGANVFRASRFLKTLGRARAGLGEFAAAETRLLEAHGRFVESPGPNPEDLRTCTQAIIDLYTAWHTAAPGKGYDAKAAEWKKALADDAVAGTAAPASLQ
jgi:serine/threonine-protein kinase